MKSFHAAQTMAKVMGDAWWPVIDMVASDAVDTRNAPSRLRTRMGPPSHQATIKNQKAVKRAREVNMCHTGQR